MRRRVLVRHIVLHGLEFEKAGEGELIHPYWGKMTVTVASEVTIIESTDQGGMAKFTLDVVESGIKETLSTPDTISAVAKKVAAAKVAVASEAEDGFSVVGFIAAVLQAAVDTINSVTSLVAKINGKINAVMNKIDAIGDAITAITDAVASLILLPGQLANSIQAVISDVMDSVNSIGDAWDSYFDEDEDPGTTAGSPSMAPSGGSPASGDVRADLLLSVLDEFLTYGDDFDTVNPTTPSRQRQADNQAATIAFIKQAAVVAACNTAAYLPFGSYTKAIFVRNRLIDELDALCEATTDDGTYAVLVDLRAALATHLNQVAASLPQVITYSLDRPLPALVLAQNIYGDSTYAVDIIARNDITNPCTLPANTDLELLSVK